MKFEVWSVHSIYSIFHVLLRTIIEMFDWLITINDAGAVCYVLAFSSLVWGPAHGQNIVQQHIVGYSRRVFLQELPTFLLLKLDCKSDIRSLSNSLRIHVTHCFLKVNHIELQRRLYRLHGMHYWYGWFLISHDVLVLESPKIRKLSRPVRASIGYLFTFLSSHFTCDLIAISSMNSQNSLWHRNKEV